MASPVAEDLFQGVLIQACASCHVQGGAANDVPGRFRSTGCSACHVERSILGRSESADGLINHDEPEVPDAVTGGEYLHIRTHRLRANRLTQPQALPFDNSACAGCHQDSGMMVAQYEGYRLDQNGHLTSADYYPSTGSVTPTYKDDLFVPAENGNQGNLTYLGYPITSWIEREIWQAGGWSARRVTQPGSPTASAATSS